MLRRWAIRYLSNMPEIDFSPVEIDFKPASVNFKPAGTVDFKPVEQQSLVARDMSLWEKFELSKVGEFFGLDRPPLMKPTREDQPLRSALGGVAYFGAKWTTGRGLHVPELVFGPDLAERIASSISAFEPTGKEKNIGNSVEFIGGIRTAGQLMRPLVGRMAVGEATRLTVGGGATFMLRNLSEQTVDKIKKGKPVSGKELLIETIIGTIFGGIETGGAKLGRLYRWFKQIKPNQELSKVPRRLWLKMDEMVRARAGGMSEKTLRKVYGKDVRNFARAAADAWAPPALARLPAAVTQGKPTAPTAMKVKAPETPEQIVSDISADVEFMFIDAYDSKMSALKGLASAIRTVSGHDVLGGRDFESLWTFQRSVAQAAIEVTAEDLAKKHPDSTTLHDAIKTYQDASVEYELRAAEFKGRKAKPTTEGHFEREPTELATRRAIIPRVETPGEMLGQRRVTVTPPGKAKALIGGLVPAKERAIVTWAESYSATRAVDLDVPLLPNDPEIRDDRLKTIRSIARTRQKFGKKQQRKIDRGRQQNVFNPWLSARHAFASVDEKTGVSVYHLYDKIMREGGAAWLDSYQVIADKINLYEMAGLTPKDNKDIAYWLFSPETRLKVEDGISPQALTVAMKVEDILQGPAAKEVQEMVARRWIKSGKAPPDAKQYGDPAIILAQAKEAKAAGELRAWVANQPPWGVRRFYYMSNPAKQDIIDDYMQQMSLGMLEMPRADIDIPGTISHEAHARKGRPPIKEGSVVSNVLSKMQRISIANAIADDLETMYARLASTHMSDVDMQHVARIFNNLMMRRQIVGQPWQTAIEVKGWFWRTRLSLLSRPDALLWMCIRNSLQNFGMGPTAVNTKEATVAAVGLGRQLAAGKSIEEIDPEMWSRFQRDFPSYVSQRRAVYQEFLLQDTSRIAGEVGSRALAQRAAALLEQTGGAYGWVDEWVNRAPLWFAQYRLTKNAAIAYTNGKIDYNQFMARTNLQTVRNAQRMLVQDLLDAGRVDDLAAESANWTTEDVNLKYKTPERAMVEQTMEQRLLMGIYTFPRGAAELMAYRGVIPMIKGVRDGNYRQAYQGTKNVIKGMAAGSAVGSVMALVLGRTAYNWWDKSRYTLLGPGAGTIAELLDINARNWYRYSQGQQSMLQTVENIADAYAENAEEFLPLADVLASTVETFYGTAGLSTFKILKDGVKVRLFGKRADWKKINRTGYQKLMHLLIGSFEYPAGKKGQLTQPTQPSQPSS